MSEQPPIPGGFVSFAEAQAALAKAAQMQLLTADAKMRLERAMTMLDETIWQIACARRDALSAIDLFAEIAPAQLAVLPEDFPAYVASVADDVHEILHDTDDVVSTAEAFLRGLRGNQP